MKHVIQICRAVVLFLIMYSLLLIAGATIPPWMGFPMGLLCGFATIIQEE